MSGIPADRCRVPQAFWLTVERIGLSPAVVLRQAGLPATLHLTGQVSITTAQYFALWKALETLAPEQGLGIKLVQMADASVHPPSTLAAFYARDYRDGLFRLARFKRLCSPEHMHVAEKKSECTITVEWLYAAEATPAVALDVAFATFVELGRRGTNQRLVPLRMELTRRRPKSDIYRTYFGCPIRYGAQRDALILKSIDLDRRFPGHNPELLDMLTPALASALGELQRSSSISEQVKAVLKRSLASGRPELSVVANELGMSERTLQRRITDEGKTFRELLVEARQELGRQLLSDAAADIDEVACLLGYQDTSSFYRAFRDWEGVTPSRWRELNINGPQARQRLVH
ncbi:AraC family transcriptional regulator [Dyella nitratireducens]|uniref:AraC family transcriptional regulator n=1 Tax=Dyella nitratireducens TaxID=1849580 RepID=A0ABQ1GY60_9GAMM|nr:AraC family transcriptional regulator [Dyella nitratireducens]GGA52665.1 AraC family transcriptional regulator [Dyella nitratireducens]GLQ44944.1 AraC family transcriptional regulator [Dyella nitratireducens]